MQKFQLSGDNLTIELAKKIADGYYEISLAPDAKKRVAASRKVIEKWIKEDKLVPGVTTGINESKDLFISGKEIEKLQRNLIISNCTAIGDPLPGDIVRFMLLLKINSLAKGFSGVSIELIEMLIKIFNEGIVPYVPSQGSAGTSGDIVPLAHLASILIGEGFIIDRSGKVKRTRNVLKNKKIEPFRLGAKEGSSLITGTQMMTSFAVEIIRRAKNLSKLADIAGSLSIEALTGPDNTFADELQSVRPHKGQLKSAANLRRLLKDRELESTNASNQIVQNSYSFRCMAQVHGAVKDTISYAYDVINTEINCATEGSLILPATEDYLTDGNFHGEPIALVMDYLKIALSELGNISEQRTARLVESNLSGPPEFLAHHSGSGSGLMFEQYSAAALVSENKLLSKPATVDSIPSGLNGEDLNSFGSISSRQCYDILINVEKIIAIEMLCACQGIDFLEPMNCGIGASAAYRSIRKKIPVTEQDVNLNDYIIQVLEIILDDEFIEFVESKAGKME